MVLLLEVDTLRADFLATHGGDAALASTPFLDRLAEQSLVFDAAHATTSWTLPSLASALTGKWPWQHAATRLVGPLGDGHETLPEAFRKGGWHTAGVMTNFLAKRDKGWAQGFELWDEELATGHEGSSAEAAVDKLLASYDTLVAGRLDPSAPIFLFGFFFEPHWRYEPDEATASLGVARFQELPELRQALAAGELQPSDLADLARLYAVEIERIDRALARLAPARHALALLAPSGKGSDVNSRSAELEVTNMAALLGRLTAPGADSQRRLAAREAGHWHARRSFPSNSLGLSALSA